MNNIGKKIEIFVIVVVIAFVGIIYAFKQKPVLAPTTTNPNLTGEQSDQQQQVPTNVIEYKGQDGQTAFALLDASHRVEVKHYSFGDMVISIDGIAPDSKHFWSFYVNDSMAQVGASDYATKSTDNIKWQIDAVVDTTK